MNEVKNNMLQSTSNRGEVAHINGDDVARLPYLATTEDIVAARRDSGQMRYGDMDVNTRCFKLAAIIILSAGMLGDRLPMEDALFLSRCLDRQIMSHGQDYSIKGARMSSLKLAEISTAIQDGATGKEGYGKIFYGKVDVAGLYTCLRIYLRDTAKRLEPKKVAGGGINEMLANLGRMRKEQFGDGLSALIEGRPQDGTIGAVIAKGID